MIRIVTDSSANISQQEAAALGIEVIPLTVIFGTEAYLEGPEITADAFYERLTGGEFPHTSQPSSAQLSEAFARCGGEETIAIFISSKLSGTVEGARSVVREEGLSNVHVVDSLATTIMLRMMVMEAWRHREKSAAEVLELLAAFRRRLRLFAAIDTLEYLHKGGRLGKNAMIIGNILGIKPIVTISAEGTVDVVGKALGQRKALKVVNDFFRAEKPDPAYPILYLYSKVDDAGRKLIEQTGGDPATAEFYNLCCAVGAHIGTNAAGLAFVSSEE